MKIECFSLILLFSTCIGISTAFRFSLRKNSLFFRRVLHQDNCLKSTESQKDYGSQSITVLKGLEPVRKRPGMYIGSTGQKGLNHLVFEVVDNSVDEALAGHCKEVSVVFHNDSTVEVIDNGRGIPCDIHPATGKSSLETVLCVLHAGGKFGGDESGYKVSGGLHGVGISVVNALSEFCKVDVFRGGRHYSMSFEKGVPSTALHNATATPEVLASVKHPALITPDTPVFSRGTKVVFRPDPFIFKTTLDFEVDRIASRMDELAYLNAGLTIKLLDLRDKSAAASLGDEAAPPKATKTRPQKDSTDAVKKPEVQVYYHEGGIKELVSNMCTKHGHVNLHPEVDMITVTEERKGITVDVAMRWSSNSFTEEMSGFANGIRTSDGGSHLDGLKSAIAKTVNAFSKKAGKVKDTSIAGEFIREGLTAIVSVKVPEPEFEGQTKTRLGNPEVRTLVDSVMNDALTTLFEWKPKVVQAIMTKALEAQAAAAAAKAAREMVRRKSLLTNTVLPGKLADCASRSPEESEIYLVEGDSAAGSAKLGRDRRTQAILPLKGKILNIYKATGDKIYQNSELQALISALGLGVKDTVFDKELLRYHRIIIMTDADVDGSHIRLLLLTFFFKYQRELIKRGHVYIACPPLYKVVPPKGAAGAGVAESLGEGVRWTKGKGGEIYLYDQESMDAYMSKFTGRSGTAATGESGGKFTAAATGESGESSDGSAVVTTGAAPVIQRFKGLGEMMPEQLWDTTMNPESRVLKLVTIEDAEKAKDLFEVLMGDDVVPRRDFIVSNVDSMKLEDLDF